MEKPTPTEIQYQEDQRDANLAPRVLVTCIICFTLATMAVCFRLLSRLLARASLGKDDFMIIAALVRPFSLSHALA